MEFVTGFNEQDRQSVPLLQLVTGVFNQVDHRGCAEFGDRGYVKAQIALLGCGSELKRPPT